MALVEIDEGELASYKQVNSIMHQLVSSPKTRQKLLQLRKEADPNLVIPEIDAAAPVMEEVKTLANQVSEAVKLFTEDKQARMEQERLSTVREQWNKGRSKLLQGGYTEEGLQAVEKFMEERGVADHEIAAAAFEKLHPPQEPIRSVGANRFDFFEPTSQADEHMKALLENPENNRALDALVNDTLRIVRGR